MAEPDVFDDYLRELAAGFAARKAPEMITDEIDDDDEFELVNVEHKTFLLTANKNAGSTCYALDTLLKDGWHIDAVTPSSASDFVAYFIQLIRFVEEPAGE